MRTFVCAGVVTLAAQGGTPLKLRTTVALQGVEGRIDHFAFDPAGERLFVCALGNNTVEVIDLRSSASASTRSTGSAHRRESPMFRNSIVLFVANDKGGSLQDLRRKIIAASRGTAVSKMMLTMSVMMKRRRKSMSDLAVAALPLLMRRTENRSARLNSAAHPEAFQLEKKGSRIFVNVPNSRHVAVIDREKGEVVARWKTDLAFAKFSNGT